MPDWSIHLFQSYPPCPYLQIVISATVLRNETASVFSPPPRVYQLFSETVPNSLGTESVLFLPCKKRNTLDRKTARHLLFMYLPDNTLQKVQFVGTNVLFFSNRIGTTLLLFFPGVHTARFVDTKLITLVGRVPDSEKNRTKSCNPKKNN